MNARTIALIAACFAGAALVRVSVPALVGYWIPVLAAGVGVWLAYSSLVESSDSENAVVLRLWGLVWTRDEACCHFFVTGATGTGKTARAVVPIVHGLRSTLPETGILAVDSKGALWKPLSTMARALGQEDTLRLIRVRPTHIAPADWTPPLRLNVLADASIPWTTYAKMIVDTATAAGQRGGQTFFKETARDLITHAMHALQEADMPVTLANVHDAICISAETARLLAHLAGHPSPTADIEWRFFKDFYEQPPEQKAGTVSTVANYLRPYTSPDIREVFCSVEPNFTLDEVDAGRLICLSIPQTYQVERRYLNLLCKQLFFLHAFRRFDLEPEEMRRRNGGGDWICTRPDHWIFAATEMKKGDGIPGLVGWEHHGAPAKIPGNEVVAEGTVWANGVNPVQWTATIYPGPKENFVFNAATIFWAQGLSSPPGHMLPWSHWSRPHGPDERVQRITSNLLKGPTV